MKTIKTEGYLSVIGTALLQPIVELWEKLEVLPRKRPNQVQTGHNENGYAVSIIILTIAMVESFLSRTRYVMYTRGHHTIPIKKKEPLLQFFDMRFKNRRLTNRLRELYVVRDAILHNHIWEAQISTEGRMVHSKPPILTPGHGDKKFTKVLNPKNRSTRILRLNLFPTRIWRRDSLIVLKTAYEILFHVERQDRAFCVVSWIPVRYNGKPIQFSKLIQILTGESIDFPNPIAVRIPK